MFHCSTFFALKQTTDGNVKDIGKRAAEKYFLDFKFRILLLHRPLKKSGNFATVNSFYNPLAFVAPIIVTGKRILQKVCYDKPEWDEEIPNSIKMQW